MMNMHPRWVLRITHEPSGEVIDVDSNNFRHQHHAKDAALGLLRARLAAKENGLFMFRSPTKKPG